MAAYNPVKDFRDEDDINIQNRTQMLYWSEKYNTSVDKIISAVKEVGPVVKNVEKRLRKKV